MSLKKTHSKTNQRGQAATEFIIASVFLLIPLFLIIPLLGKYIDIRHAAIQQARFEAWEYTAWSGPDERIMSGIKSDESAGIKNFTQTSQHASVLDTRQQGLLYFFSDPTVESYGNPEASFELNPLWTDHRGDSLFTSSSEIITGAISENYTPDGFRHILSTILEVIGEVVGFVGELMSLIGGDGKFDAIYMKGYFTSNVDVKLRSIDNILPQYTLSTPIEKIADPLEIQAKASVLTNGWNAGSRENATSESRGLVFSSFLRPVSKTFALLMYPINTLFDTIKKLSVITPPKLPGVPDFGYVEDDLLPFEHLDPNNKELKEESGLYYYE